MAAYIKLQNWWSSTGADVNTRSVAMKAITPINSRYDVVLPPDFQQYLLEGSPVDDNWDDDMGNWWPIERIKNIPDEYGNNAPAFIPNGGRKYLFFLDHCIWCWAWAISCEDGPTYGKVALIGSGDDRFVAATFSEFVERYISDWVSVN